MGPPRAVLYTPSVATPEPWRGRHAAAAGEVLAARCGRTARASFHRRPFGADTAPSHCDMAPDAGRDQFSGKPRCRYGSIRRGAFRSAWRWWRKHILGCADDLQMAARLLRPGGVVVLDNSDQNGPFGGGLPGHESVARAGPIDRIPRGRPFNDNRIASQHRFVLLQRSRFFRRRVACDWHCANSVAWERCRAGLAPARTDGQLHYRVSSGPSPGNRWGGRGGDEGRAQDREWTRRASICQVSLAAGLRGADAFPGPSARQIDLVASRWRLSPFMLSSSPLAF